MPRSTVPYLDNKDFTFDDETAQDTDRVTKFRQRQQQDLKRYRNEASSTGPRRRLQEVSDEYNNPHAYQQADLEYAAENTGGWRDSDGDRLGDFGVDEAAELFDEDSIALAEVMRRRHAQIEAKSQ